MDNFDLKKYLVENKVTKQSRLYENLNDNDLKLCVCCNLHWGYYNWYLASLFGIHVLTNY